MALKGFLSNKGLLPGEGGGTGTTDLGYNASANNGVVTSSTGNSATIPAADETNAGLLLPAEKTKLASIAGVYTASDTPPTSPAVDDVWLDTNSSRTPVEYTWFIDSNGEGYWVNWDSPSISVENLTVNGGESYSEYVEIQIAQLATHTQRIGVDGVLIAGSDNNWRSTAQYLKAEAGDTITMYCYSNPIVGSVCFYDVNKVFISSYKNSTYTNPFNSSVVAPAGTKFIRISFGSDAFAGFTNSFIHRLGVATRHLRNEGLITDLEAADVTLHGVLDPLHTEVSKLGLYKSDLQRTIELVLGDKGILYGDSISSVNYTWYKEAMEDLTGVEVYNGGFSAFTASGLAADACLSRIFTYAPKFIIVLLGGNDTGGAGTVGTFSGAVTGEPIKTETNISLDYPTTGGNSYIQAVDHIMRKIKAYYYNIRQRAGLVGGETNAQVEAAIDAVLKPHIIFLSGIPQQRTNSSDAYSLSANWKRKRDAVIECGIKNRIHVIDTHYSFDVDMSLEPFYIGPTDMTTNYGVYYMDGVHPNKFGFRKLSEIVVSKASILKYNI